MNDGCRRRGPQRLGTFACLATLLACASSPAATSPDHPAANSPDAGAPGASAEPFVALEPRVYVAKVKNLLVGLPPSADEVHAVEADSAALGELIDSWMKLPQYRTKLLAFFQLAFQQTQLSIDDFDDQTYPRKAAVNPATRDLLAANASESFARTVLALIDEGQPFTEAMTTHRFMMTPALMELYAFLDAWQVDDAGTVTDRFRKAHPKLEILVEASAGAIPIEQSLDPGSPNYMRFYQPSVGDEAMLGAGCGEDPIHYAGRADVLHFLLHGSLLGRKNAAGNSCRQAQGSEESALLSGDDFTHWTMVRVRAPQGDEDATAFYDLPALRKADELVLHAPRVGFFTTPAFFANWPTNISNQMRVTINQALIVATGAAIDGSDATAPPSTPGLDPVHSSPSDCLYCHRTLDPTRSILTATYSFNYHEQADPVLQQQHGLFAFQGVVQDVASVDELGMVLAQHPLFAQAWVQKLCFYANSEACDVADPEFQRIAEAFRDSGYQWPALVRALFASPLTTYASPTLTTSKSGGLAAVTRRDHLCAAFDARLGLDDVCRLHAPGKAAQRGLIPKIVAGLPSDGYGRGAVAPVLPNRPSLLQRAGTENVCAALAPQLIDVPKARRVAGVKLWSSSEPDAAIADFVHELIGLSEPDPRAAAVQSLLHDHFIAARAKTSASNALKSTFITACLAPGVVAIGM